MFLIYKFDNELFEFITLIAVKEQKLILDTHDVEQSSQE